MRGSILPPHRMSPTLRSRKRSGDSEHGREAGGPRPFRHGLLQGEIGVHRALEMGLVDQDDVGHEFPHHRQRQRPDILDRDAFGERRAADRAVRPGDRVAHGRIERGLDADDLHLRPHPARGDGVAGDQPAAADGNDEHVEIADLLEHFERHGALSGDDGGIVIGVDQDERMVARHGGGAFLAFAQRFAVEHHLGAIGLGRLHLHEGRRHRHHDGGGNAETPGMVGHRLGVVAGRHGDDAAAALRRRQRGELDVGAAVLERVRHLQVFVFDEHLGAGQGGELGRREHRGAQHRARQRAPGGLHVRERDRHKTCFPWFCRRRNLRRLGIRRLGIHLGIHRLVADVRS